MEPGGVDAAMAKQVMRADGESGAVLDAIFDASAERLYAGGAVREAVSAAERERVLEALAKLCRR
jgi:hypothetical protein